jgi:hypothetical protein
LDIVKGRGKIVLVYVNFGQTAGGDFEAIRVSQHSSFEAGTSLATELWQRMIFFGEAVFQLFEME